MPWYVGLGGGSSTPLDTIISSIPSVFNTLGSILDSMTSNSIVGFYLTCSLILVALVVFRKVKRTAVK